MGSLNCYSHDTVSTFTLQLPRSRALPYSTFFENNHYIRALNKILQLELGAIDLYKHCTKMLEVSNIEGLIVGHQDQAKNLVNLIVHNRGIPDKDGFSLSPELSLWASGLARYLGSSMARKTSQMSCLHLERQLHRRYQLAVKEAPFCDRALLAEHVARIGSHIESLVQAQLA